MRYTLYVTFGMDSVSFVRFWRLSYWRDDLALGIPVDANFQLWRFWIHIQVWQKTIPPYDSLQDVKTFSVNFGRRNVIFV